MGGKWFCPNCQQEFGRPDNITRHLKTACKKIPYLYPPYFIHSCRISETSDAVATEIMIPNKMSADSIISPYYSKLMKHWHTFREHPTYDAGLQALEVWLGSGYPSLSKAALSVTGTSQSFAGKPVCLSDILVDMAQPRRLHVWNSAECSKSEITRANSFIGSMFQCSSLSASQGLTALAIRATDKGVLSCNPQVPTQYTDRGQTIPFVYSEHKATKVSKTQPLWEAIVSQPAAVTSFHIDSHGSGHYILQISGTKVICACPCTPQNWEIIKPYYMQATPIDKYLSILVSLTYNQTCWAYPEIRGRHSRYSGSWQRYFNPSGIYSRCHYYYSRRVLEFDQYQFV